MEDAENLNSVNVAPKSPTKAHRCSDGPPRPSGLPPPPPPLRLLPNRSAPLPSVPSLRSLPEHLADRIREELTW